MLTALLMVIVGYFWWKVNQSNGYFYYCKHRMIIVFVVDLSVLILAVGFLSQARIGIQRGALSERSWLSDLEIFRLLDEVLFPLVTTGVLVFAVIYLLVKVSSDIVRLAKNGYLDIFILAYAYLYLMTIGLIVNLIRRRTEEKRRKANQYQYSRRGSRYKL